MPKMYGKKKNISECEFINIKDNRLRYKCKESNKKSNKPINGLIKKFPNIYKFCKGDLNKWLLSMVEEGIRAKANNKYMNDYSKRKIVSYLRYLDANNLYG